MHGVNRKMDHHDDLPRECMESIARLIAVKSMKFGIHGLKGQIEA
jgi:hypothetical protein